MIQNINKLTSILKTILLTSIVILFSLILTSCNFSLKDSKHENGSSIDTELPKKIVLKDMSINVGSDELSFGVTWFSNTSKNGVLQIIRTSDIKDNDFDSSDYRSIDAEVEKCDNEGFFSNKVTVIDLEPESNYSFRYGNSDNWSDIATYNTKSKELDTTEFLAYGDPQLGAGETLEKDSTNWIQTVQYSLKAFPNTQFLLTLGDHANEFNDTDIIASQYTEFFKLSSYTSIPLATITGNHEVRTSLLLEHQNYPNMNTPVKTEFGSSLPGDYYFTYGNSLIMVLACSYSYDCSDHNSFIQKTMDKFKDCRDIKWNIVAFHPSLYSAAGHATSEYSIALRDNLAETLYSHNIDLVLMGHDHVYVRSYPIINKDADILKDSNDKPLDEYVSPSGPVYITLNSSSNSKHYELLDEDFDYAAVIKQDTVANYSRINTTDDSLNVVTYRTTDNSIVDSLTIKKK